MGSGKLGPAQLTPGARRLAEGSLVYPAEGPVEAQPLPF